jgi:hypothetical protein
MSGFAKLVPEIIQSSIWNESSEVRIVWITMLAVKNEDGYVRGDANTLSRLANVPLEAARLALEKFQQPDPSSHTPANEGRRIEPAPGGWIVLNHDLYRAKDYNEHMRDYMRDRRQSLKGVNNMLKQVNDPSVSVSVSSSASGIQEGVKGEPGIPDGYHADTSQHCPGQNGTTEFNPEAYTFSKFSGYCEGVRAALGKGRISDPELKLVFESWPDKGKLAFITKMWCMEVAAKPSDNPGAHLRNFVKKHYGDKNIDAMMAAQDRARRTV